VLVSSFALFSLVQWENFLLSINVAFFAVVAFSVVSIVAMARYLLGQYKRMTAATFFAVAVVTSELALLSMGGGVVVWVVNLVQIALAIVLFQVRALRALFAYLTIAIISLGAYLWGLNAGGSLSFLISNPLETFAYFMIGTGNSIVGWFSSGPVLWLDFLVGFILNMIFVFIFTHFVQLSREEQKRSLVLVSLILFGLLEQALVTYGRLPLSLSSAANSRYSTLTVVAAVAALIFLSLYADVSTACLRLAVSLGLVMLVFTVIADRKQMISAGASHYYYSLLQQILLDDKKIGPREQQLLQWEGAGDIIQQGNEVLRKYRLSFYRDLAGPS
jgi:hypothetical protein